MYTVRAREQRLCRGTRGDGAPCRQYAMWDDALQRCNAHAGRTRGRQLLYAERFERIMQHTGRARYIPCTCGAYDWPHRPGGGRCCWPDVLYQNNTKPAPALRISGVYRRSVRPEK